MVLVEAGFFLRAEGSSGCTTATPIAQCPLTKLRARVVVQGEFCRRLNTCGGADAPQLRSNVGMELN